MIYLFCPSRSVMRCRLNGRICKVTVIPVGTFQGLLAVRVRLPALDGSPSSITHLSIARSGADSSCLISIQLLQRGKCVLRLLDVSMALIGPCEVRVNRWAVRIKLSCLFQMRDCVLKATAGQVEAAQRNLRSRIVRLLLDRFLQNRRRLCKLRFTCVDARANQSLGARARTWRRPAPPRAPSRSGLPRRGRRQSRLPDRPQDGWQPGWQPTPSA